MGKEKNNNNSGNKGRCNIYFWLLMIAVLIIISQSLYMLLIVPKTACPVQEDAFPSDMTGKNLLALVNGAPIYADELELAYQSIPASLRTNDSLNIVFNTLINNKLLLQDAASRGLAVSEEEVDDAVTRLLSANSITMVQLEELLAQQGRSLLLFRDEIRNSLLLEKEIAELTKDVKAPTETDLQLYYSAAQENLVSPGSATVRQIMIYANSTNNQEKSELIRTVADKLSAGADFCEAVRNYSEDTATFDKCGEYIFAQGQLLPEFEQVVFNSSVGDVKLFQTRIGYHIVAIGNITQPRKLGYEEAKESIRNYFVQANQQAVLNEHITVFREKAEIVSYID